MKQKTIYKNQNEKEYVFLSSDMNVLLKRIEVLFGLFHAGSANAISELTSITDELLKSNKITKHQFKSIRSLFNK